MKQHVKSDDETVSGGENPGEEEMSPLTQISLERSERASSLFRAHEYDPC